MKTKLLIIIAALVLTTVANAETAGKEDNLYKYELISWNGNTAQEPGWQIVKVWSYGHRKNLTRENCIKNAIHGILFKGFPREGANAGMNALVPEGYEAHKKFFDDFFDGKFRQYVQLTNNGDPQPGDIIKIKGSQYKIGMVVLVNVNALRTYLKQEGIAKDLDFLF